MNRVNLGREIDSVFNEYNMIKNQINSAKRINPYFSNDNTNRITQGLNQSDILYQSPIIYNNNIEINRKPNNPILEEFRNVIRDAQILTNDANLSQNYNINNNEMYKNNFSNFDGEIMKPMNIIDYKDDYSISKNSSNHSVHNDEDLFDLDDLSDEINMSEENLKNINYNENIQSNINNIQNLKKKSINKNINNDIIINNKNYDEITMEKEIEKITLTNNILKQSNNDLRNENNILELEIRNYESQTKNLLTANSIFSKFDKNLQTFITNIKANLKETTEQNLKTLDSIILLGEKIKKYKKENQDLYSKYGERLLEIEKSSRINAEIEIFNQQNEKNIISLKENYKELNENYEELKLELDNLLSQEKDLNLLIESCKIRKEDNEELINRLKLTITKLKGEKDDINNKANKNNIQIFTEENNLFSKESQIKQLNDIITKITNDKIRITQINEDMKQQIDNKYENKKDLLLKEKEFSQNLQNVIEKNEELKRILEDKENQIKELKIKNEKVSNTLKKGEEIDDSEINDLIEDDEEEIIKKENKEKEMDLEIKKALEDNIKKDNEINELTKQFEDLIQKKDDEINKLQIQIGENPLNNQETVEGLESIDLNNNLDLGQHEEIDTDILNNIDTDRYDNKYQNNYYKNESGIKNENNDIENIEGSDNEYLNNYLVNNNNIKFTDENEYNF